MLRAILRLCLVSGLTPLRSAPDAGSSLASRRSAHQGPSPCRENTEGEYSGLEHEVVPDVIESLKVSNS